MSRIHEALKKAEQERATSQGGPVQPSFETPVEESTVAVAAAVPAGAKLFNDGVRLLQTEFADGGTDGLIDEL